MYEEDVEKIFSETIFQVLIMSFLVKKLSNKPIQASIYLLKNKNIDSMMWNTGSTVSHLFTNIQTQSRFFSGKENEKNFLKALDYSKTKQTLVNKFALIFSSVVSKIEPKPCKDTIILENVKQYLEKNVPIQINQGCLLETIRIVDRFNKRQSVLDDPEIIKVLSGKILINEANIQDSTIKIFLKAHLTNQNILTEQQKNMSSTDKNFITKTIGHSQLIDTYISANELENHFRNTGQPTYSMILWDESYQLHSILIFGIDKEDNIYYWDVSDKLPSGSSRIKTMNIEDFNNRRNLPPQYSSSIIQSGWARSAIFYYKEN